MGLPSPATVLRQRNCGRGRAARVVGASSGRGGVPGRGRYFGEWAGGCLRLGCLPRSHGAGGAFREIFLETSRLTTEPSCGGSVRRERLSAITFRVRPGPMSWTWS